MPLESPNINCVPKKIELYIPEKAINDNTEKSKDGDEISLLSCKEVHDMLIDIEKKSIGFFDENVTAYIVVPTNSSIRGKLTVDIHHRMNNVYIHDQPSDSNRIEPTSTHVLEACKWEDKNFQIWEFSFDINPGRNSNALKLHAYFEAEIVAETGLIKPFSELDFMQLGGIDLLRKNCLSGNSNDIYKDEYLNIANKQHILEGSITIEISSLYKMALKSYKTEKTLAWLDLSPSKKIVDLGKSIKINLISIQCSNCDVKSCSPIKFPLKLDRNSLLTVAYHVLYDSETSIKPLVVIIDSVIDEYKHIRTKWTSNLDLSNNDIFSQKTNSSGNLSNNKKLLPGAKLSKSRSYSGVTSNQSSLNSPRLRPSHSTGRFQSNNGVTGAINSNNNNYGGKRYSSIRLKSSSNISLSQLWSDTTSQKFQRGLVISVSGSTRVKLGEPFRWKIQLLNKSKEKMDLILYVQSSIKKDYQKQVPPIPIQSGNKNDIVPLFPNNQLVRNFYHKFNRAGLVSLTNNLRVSLEHGHLYECELELNSVERGTFNIYDFKVMDIISGDLFECNRLLDVMVI